MPEEATIVTSAILDRRSLIESLRQTNVYWFQELVNRDRFLAVQMILDPPDTLAKFELQELGDNALLMQVTQGSLLDLVHLWEIMAARDLANAVAAPRSVSTGAVGELCVVVTTSATSYWNHVCFTSSAHSAVEF